MICEGSCYSSAKTEKNVVYVVKWQCDNMTFFAKQILDEKKTKKIDEEPDHYFVYYLFDETF